MQGLWQKTRSSIALRQEQAWSVSMAVESQFGWSTVKMRRNETMARTHRANCLLESVPGYDFTTLNSMSLKLSSVHFLLPTTFSSFLYFYLNIWDHHLHGHPSQNCHSHPQLLHVLHVFHLISHQYLSIPSLRYSLNLPSSLSHGSLVQAIITSLLGSVTTSVLVLFQFILHVIVISLKYRFDFVTSLRKIL